MNEIKQIQFYKVPWYNKYNQKFIKCCLKKMLLDEAEELKEIYSQEKLSVEEAIYFC